MNDYQDNRRTEPLVSLVNKADAETIRQAAAAMRMTVSTFLLFAALEKAGQLTAKAQQ